MIGVSCICPTFARPHLLEEAIESFLRQDYTGPKELIILNDLDLQTLHIRHPEILCVNVKKRFRTLGEKYNAAFALASYDVYFPWDDDDIHLPQRISFSLERLGDGEFYQPRLAYYKVDSMIRAGCHASSSSGCWRRSLFLRIGGFSAMDTGLDQDFDRKAGVQSSPIEPHEATLYYRWGETRTYHASWWLEGASGRAGDFARQAIEAGQMPAGFIELKPHWREDYVALTRPLDGPSVTPPAAPLEGAPRRDTILSEAEQTLSLEQLLTMVEKSPLGSSFRERSSKLLERHLNVGRTVVPRATVCETPKPFLTIGMATYDDYDGVFFSVMAIRLFHPEILDSVEILVVDNHPQGRCAEPLKALEGYCRPCYRYLPVRFVHGTAVRDVVFQAARGDFVLCMDCHVMFAPGGLKRLLDYLRQNPDSRDLLQGPMFSYDLKKVSTHWDDQWGAGMWGQWGTDARGESLEQPPFEISMMGLGIFCCRKAVWPGLSHRLRGFGGEEGCLHEKFRGRGGRALCLPFLLWLHRFERPMGVHYPVSSVDRARNYLILFQEAGLSTEPVFENLSEMCGLDVCQAVERELEKEEASPFFPFEGLFCVFSGLEEAEVRAGLSQESTLARFSFVRFPASSLRWNVAEALELRAICQESRLRNLESILVVELKSAGTALDWEELGRRLPAAPGWRLSGEGVFSQVLGLSRQLYSEIGDEIPENPVDAALWLRHGGGLEAYLERVFTGNLAESARCV